eukprot:CAMPEP_0195524766 /NCGR_PEP_ID=MMETSP0794_2-20130614/24798_1 /TAXON_ID=515487 /ORGANISM="Stephanopyxis turris, Strain CCMP 815" /LENGTH=517 /DNA_ID=CAMNT_0040655057 /DNA_START=34 /DNA_END=1587 /DNA_ORIENTATION=+
MARFQVFAAALFSAQACASFTPDNLRERRLDNPIIAGYAPTSTVTDHAALDQDQEAMVSAIGLGTEEGLQTALDIYTKGGNSKSYAVLTLIDSAISTAMAKGTAVSGTNESGMTVTGKLYYDVTPDATSITVQYATTDQPLNHVGCRVGGLTSATTDGCFGASGTVTVGETELTYSYDVLTGNQNGRTLNGFSTSAKDKMYMCEKNCPYNEYKAYYDYYKQFDYASQFVTGAISRTQTQFMNNDKDFSDWPIVARGEMAKKASAYMSVYMYVIREFEDAYSDCTSGCIDCNDDPVHAWDEGVAFYTGSLEGSDGSGDGAMLYGLADKRCINFNTCGENGGELSGRAKINYQAFDLFHRGQGYIQTGECDKLPGIIGQITEKMRVPLVQGTLRYAYKVGELNGGEKEKAEGDVFAAAILPVVHACDSSAAATIQENMEYSARTTDAAAVKAAFESVYSCMGITCDDVGGLFNSGTGMDYPGAEACGSGSAAMDSPGYARTGVLAALGSVAGAAAMMAL